MLWEPWHRFVQQAEDVFYLRSRDRTVIAQRCRQEDIVPRMWKNKWLRMRRPELRL